MTTISISLKKLRKNLNLTQKEFAASLGVTSSAVSNWENGINKIDVDTIITICKNFNISISEFVGLSDSGFVLSENELNLLIAYREHPEMQEAVNRLLKL